MRWAGNEPPEEYLGAARSSDEPPRGRHPTPGAPPERAGVAEHLTVPERTDKMKQGIHPDYHEIRVVMTDGTEFVTRSCYGAKDAKLNLDIDPKVHPAWTGGQQQLMDRGGRLSRFNSKFGGLFSTK
jgi:large subunit ribosomal protein L31